MSESHVSTITIRACITDDIEAVLNLDRAWEQEAIAHIFAPISRDEFIATLTQFPRYFLVANNNGRIVGYINGTIQHGTTETIIPADQPYLSIENLYVEQAFRHQQIGGRLLQCLLETAEQQGIKRSMVSSNSRQIEKILAFYQEFGFTLWHIQLYK
jgi:ribosomal protein S18 acetylase RimI-like enzyme